jgi:hypothetical protein
MVEFDDYLPENSVDDVYEMKKRRKSQIFLVESQVPDMIVLQVQVQVRVQKKIEL